MEDLAYSVLMSVYAKERPEYLRRSMESMFAQTVPTDDFVLICDGPLTKELDEVIAQMQSKFGSVLRVIRLKQNGGLGHALRIGVLLCKNELIARMDSDDVSVSNRCERQLEEFQKKPELSILSATILEFKDTTKNIIGARVLPEKDKEIKKFSHRRCPFNHPTVMFKKSAVQAVGGYAGTYPLFEDYDLWVRMLQNGSIGSNIQAPLLFMRVSDQMYLRRGGREYVRQMMKFRKWMLDTGYINWGEYILSAFPHTCIGILPNAVRKAFYGWIHSRLDMKNMFEQQSTHMTPLGGGNPLESAKQR